MEKQDLRVDHIDTPSEKKTKQVETPARNLKP